MKLYHILIWTVLGELVLVVIIVIKLTTKWNGSEGNFFVRLIVYDKMLLGDREVAIAAVLEDGKEELAPVEKLRQPFEYTETEEFAI